MHTHMCTHVHTQAIHMCAYMEMHAHTHTSQTLSPHLLMWCMLIGYFIKRKQRKLDGLQFFVIKYAVNAQIYFSYNSIVYYFMLYVYVCECVQVRGQRVGVVSLFLSCLGKVLRVGGRCVCQQNHPAGPCLVTLKHFES